MRKVSSYSARRCLMGRSRANQPSCIFNSMHSFDCKSHDRPFCSKSPICSTKPTFCLTSFSLREVYSSVVIVSFPLSLIQYSQISSGFPLQAPFQPRQALLSQGFFQSFCCCLLLLTLELPAPFCFKELPSKLYVVLLAL